MDIDRLNLKIYAQDPPPVASLIPVFHRWISEGALGETWVDVADYRHVPAGPGVLLVAHHAHYGWDAADGAWGLGVHHKRPRGQAGPTPAVKLLADVLARTLRAAATLARDPALGPFGWTLDRFTVTVPDRLHAPNTPQTLQQLEPEVRGVFEAVAPGVVGRVEAAADLRGPATLRVALEPAPSFAECLARVAS